MVGQEQHVQAEAMRQVRDRRYQVTGEIQGVQVRVGNERGHLRDFVVLQLQDAQLGYERNMAGIDKFENIARFVEAFDAFEFGEAVQRV